MVRLLNISRVLVDLASISGILGRFESDFGQNRSLSGVVNTGLQIAFQKRAQKRLKTPKKLSPHWVFTVHPDLPAGTPCYNFTGPTRNTV